MHTNENIPWVEKYRPTKFDEIVLDTSNRTIFDNVLTTGHFPNLMFYGPPGTGKTTTIMNLINEFNTRYNPTSKGSVIHLNASDERGIDIIRNQIYQFVKSSNFFNKGPKFVILDEVDYMTKNAQHALKYLLQTTSYNVRYCLICNYISKVDESLQNEFICIRFNQLPQDDIRRFIEHIVISENLDIDMETIEQIQQMHHSDIRSMINFIQLHQDYKCIQTNIVSSSTWNKMHKIVEGHIDNDLHEFVQQISIQYNIDKKSILKDYFNYVMRNHPEKISVKYLTNIEVTLHAADINSLNTINYIKYVI